MIVAIVLVANSALDCAIAQVPQTPEDPLRHGHALLIGNSHYSDPSWPQLDDIPLQLLTLQKGLKGHFDSIEVISNLKAKELREKINDFVRTYGNENDARLFIYYAGHGYTEIIRERNENRGYITGVDTPAVDGTARGYAAARLKAISMGELRGSLEDVVAKSILFLFDSCFAGTIFTDRGVDALPPLTNDVVAKLMEKPARDFITAGRADQRVPAHSPIPELFLEALNGGADSYGHGVIATPEIQAYLLDRILQMRNIDLTPQEGRLPDPAFAEGAFLFRVLSPTMPSSNKVMSSLPEQETPRNVEHRELTHSYAVKVGATVRIGTYYLINTKSCAAGPVPKIVQTSKPTIGKVVIEKTQVEPTQEQCKGFMIPSMIVSFQAGDTAGEEKITYEVTYASKKLGTVKVENTISVVPGAISGN
jgi:hypothetical protein